MGANSSPIIRYTQTSWLDSLGAYNLNTGVDAQLDWLRKIIRSGGYIYKGFAFPVPGNDLVAARDSYNGNLSVLPGSYLTMITGYTNEPLGFQLQIFDEGAESYLYNGLFGKDGAVVGQMVAPAGAPAGFPFGPFIFPSPVVVLPPGRLNVEVTNLGIVQRRIQILIHCAIPISNVSFGTPQGNEGSGG